MWVANSIVGNKTSIRAILVNNVAGFAMDGVKAILTVNTRLGVYGLGSYSPIYSLNREDLEPLNKTI